MKGSLPVLIGASALFLVAAAIAAPLDYLFRGERLCDAKEVFCFRGTLSYQSNSRLLSLHARVQTAPGPGRGLNFESNEELGQKGHSQAFFLVLSIIAER